MRYYKIAITNAGKPVVTFTSHPQGVSSPPDPGALQVEINCFSGPFVDGAGQAVKTWVRIWGISISQIAQAFDLYKKNIEIFGGMGKGLPLANPAQSGRLISGSIYQALGNWIGTEMTLDLLVGPIIEDQPAAATANNIVVNWQKNTELSQVIKTTLTTAFPGYTVDVNIKSGLVLPNSETGYYPTMEQFNKWVTAISKKIGDSGANLGPWATNEAQPAQKYEGVQIFVDGKTIKVYDGTDQSLTKAIAFNDLIGQPVWNAVGQIMVTTAMRADIVPNTFVTLPATPINATEGIGIFNADSNLRNSSIFKGKFQVIRANHVGNYKQPDSRSWVSTFLCASQAIGGSGATTTPPVASSFISPAISTVTTPASSPPKTTEGDPSFTTITPPSTTGTDPNFSISINP